MPQIDLNSPKTKKNIATKTPKQSDDASFQNPWGSSPWGDDFGDMMSGGDSKPSRMTPQERVTMIEKVYEEVLSRKPDTRDINYYKYSTLSEDEIRRQLLAGKEHRQLIEDGKEFKKMRERATQAETRIKMLEAQNRDQLEEFKHLTKLLKEKNVYIQSLRDKLKNPYNMIEPISQTIVEPSRVVQATTTEEAPQQIFTSSTEKNYKDDKKGIFDRIKEVIAP